MARFTTQVVPNEDAFDVFCHDNALDEECFRSTGWETEAGANGRATEHLTEHATGVPSRELGAYRAGVSQEEYEIVVAKYAELNSVELPEGVNV